MAITAEASSSTAPLQPVKKAGQGAVSRDAEVSEAGKRRRLDSNAAATAAAGTQSNMVPVNAAATPNAAHQSRSSPSSTLAAATSASASGSTPSPTADTQRTAPAGSPISAVTGTSPSLDVTEYVPLHIGSAKLRSSAGIDNQSPTQLNIDVRVHALHPSAQVPVVSRLVFQSTAAAAQRDQTAFLLGPNTGFAVKVPQFPLFLTKAQADRGIVEIVGAQLEWLSTLRTVMSQYSGTLRDSRAPVEAKKTICQIVSRLLGELQTSNLWPETEQTKSWNQILCDGSAIKRYQSSRSSNGKKPSETSYRLTLSAASPEAMFIVASCLTTYSLLGTICPETTAAWRRVLGDDDSAAANATDSDASSDDAGWQRVKNGRRRPPNSYYGTKRRDNNIDERMRSTEANIPDLSRKRYALSTPNALLALSTTLSLHPVTIPYTSYRIDNWQSLGCDTQRLIDDPVFKQLMAAPSLPQSPAAHWSVSQHAGDAVVSLWGRDSDEFKAKVVELNSTVAGVLGLSAPTQLRICCTMVRKTRSGRVDYSDSLTVYLTPTVVVAPPPGQTRVAVATTAPSSPPAPGSYAAAAGAGIKRAAELRALNHQPRKAQKAAPAANSAPPPSQKFPPTQSSQQRQKQSNAGPSSARSPQPSSAGSATQPLGNAIVPLSISAQQLVQEQKQLRQYCDEQIAVMASSVSKQLADMVAVQNNMMQLMQSMMQGMRQMVQEVMQQLLQPPRPLPQQPPSALCDPALVALHNSAQQQQPLHIPLQQLQQPQQQQHSIAAFNAPSTAVSVDQLMASASQQLQQYHGGVGRQFPSQTDVGSVLHPTSSSASAGPARNGQAVSHV
jgi:hypothetical protein